MMIFTNAALQERGITRRISDHQRQRGRPVDRRLHRVLRRPAGAQGHHHLCRGDLGSREVQGGLPLARAAGKSIVALKLGQSEGGRQRRDGAYRLARRQHRGVRCGRGRGRRDPRRHARRRGRDRPSSRRIPARRPDAGSAPMTLSGAFRGLLLDAAERNGLRIPAAGAGDDRTAQRRCSTVGSLVANPIDGGFGVLSSADNYMASIEALQADPNVDMVLVQEGLPREPGSDRAENYIRHRRGLRCHQGQRSRSPSSRRSRTARPTTAARCAPRRRTCRSCRRPTRRCAPSPARRGATSSSGWPRTAEAGQRRRPSRARVPIERRAQPRAPSKRSRSTRSNPRTCCAPTASPTPAEDAGDVARRGDRRRPSGSAIRSCSRRCRRHAARTSPMSARSRSISRRRERLTRRLRPDGAEAARPACSPACWSASRSAAASSWCSACTAIPKWVWW